MNPFVRISDFKNFLVLDFESSDPALGASFADQVAFRLTQLDPAFYVARSAETSRDPAIQVAGTIVYFDPGSAATRRVFGDVVGNADFKAVIQLTVSGSGEQVADFKVETHGKAVSPRSDVFETLRQVMDRGAIKAAETIEALRNEEA